jgi:hypothetical protein
MELEISIDARDIQFWKPEEMNQISLIRITSYTNIFTVIDNYYIESAYPIALSTS